jgi:hypothetical protein
VTNEAKDFLAHLEEVLIHQFEEPEALDLGLAIEDEHERGRFYVALIKDLQAREQAKARYKEPPVTPEVFFTDPYFMGHTVSLWPRLKEQVIEACSGQYVEAVLTGAIGTGKTTAALCILAFSTYQVMNLRDPHGEYQLDRNSEIAFVMQSVTGKTAFTVDYMRFRRMLENSPWFQRNAPHDPEKKATIQFLDPVSRRPVPLFVQPLPGTETAAIGENVFGGLIDEVNHMKVVQQSSKKMGGETHDQMLENYRAISRRRESRFQRTGKVPGMLCLVGSANYAGQFTDRKREERDRQLERDGETQIYIYDKRPWEVQPDDRFSPERFRVFLGDGTRKPRVIPDGEATHPNDEPYLMWVPVDYRNAFDSDLPGAVKDIAGIALHGFSNFISNYSAIKAAFGTRTNIFDPDWCDFDLQPARITKHKIENPDLSRYVHIDLSLSMDNAALSIAHCPGFREIDRGGGMRDMMPVIRFDGMLSIRPPGGSQIPIHKIKKLVFALKEMGYNIEWVSLDGFQSADFIQTMRRNRLSSGILSLDRTAEPYMLTRQLIYDGCCEGPASALACGELKDLVWIGQKQKVDHPAEGSKDLADTIAGCCYGLASKRAVWVRWGVDPRKSSVMLKKGKDE